jgi:hypothetical protein
MLPEVDFPVFGKGCYRRYLERTGWALSGSSWSFFKFTDEIEDGTVYLAFYV